MNIVGEGINKTISGQIKKRQEIYGSISRTPEQLEYLNARTAFAKLISSVNIKDTFKPTSTELKNILNSIQGSNLAKDFVLFNGTQDADRITGRSGIARNGSILNNNAYGLGGLEFGLRAMPGIISATTKSENRGSLRTTTVQIKAWNRTQFEIIDLLYLRLGYSILFEFGNTIYFENDGTLIRNRPPSLEDTFLAGKYTVSSILKAIQDLRIKSNGNYDAVYGKVVNFSWQFLEDGSYDITVIVRSIGDVIESLKTNVLISDSSILFGGTSEVSGSAFQSVPNQFQSNATSNGVTTGVSTATQTEETPTIESYADKHQIGKLLFDAKNFISAFNSNVGGCKAAAMPLNIPAIQGKKHILQQNYEGLDEPQYYIRLGSFLAYLENFIVPKYLTGDNAGEPIINFDYTEQNYIYTIPNQVSMDPRVCLINTSITSGAGNIYTYASQGEPYVEKVSEHDVGKVMNIYVNFMYILTTMDANLDESNKVPLINLLTTLLTGISNALGSINTLEPFVDEVENIVRITDQSSLPGKYDILSAIDKVKPNDTTILDLYGYYNRKGEGSSAGFVRNFGIKTEITPNLATMLSIGAQAAGAVVGEDATGFSKLNEGLEDRIKNDVVDAITKTDKAKSKLEELNERFPNANTNFSEAAFQLGSLNGSTPTWDAENIDSYSQLQSDFLTYQNTKQAITNKKSSPSTPFIPINLNLVLDGISGLKIYNTLRVDASYLPSNYPASMDFIITGLSHTIQNNVWTTEIDTNMVPRDPSQAAGGSYKGRPGGGSSSGGGGSSSGGGGSSFRNESRGPAQKFTGKTITSEFPLNPTGHQVANIKKSQLVFHYSASGQKSDKGLSTINFLNKTRDGKGLSYHYIIDATGHVEQLVPDGYIAYHATSANNNSIGISLLNYGYGKNALTSSYGKIPVGQQKNVKLVNYEGKEAPYRNITWAQEITDAQLTALRALVIKIKQNNPDIPAYKWEGETTFNKLFPPNNKQGRTTSWKAKVGGFYTHNSVTTGKADILPTPKLVNFFKTLVL